MIKYHAKLFYGSDKDSYWSDWNKDALIANLIVPYINGQVVKIVKGKGHAILNLKSVYNLVVYKTDYRLADKEVSPYSQMADPGFEKFECTEEILKEAKIEFSAKSGNLSLLQKTFVEVNNQVFVIMKFGDKALDSAYEGVIKPLFNEFGINVIRVDEIPNSGKITEQILELIARSKYILADLSGERPNCYYETGFAHALGKEIILTIKSDEKVHFDLSGNRFIQWETESELRRKLKKRIELLEEKN